MVGFAEDWDQSAAWTPNTEISFTGEGSGLINTPVNVPAQTQQPTPTATAGDTSLQNLTSNIGNATYTAPSVNDVTSKPEAIAGAEKSPTVGGEKKGVFDTIGESFSKTMQKHGGEIFANTLSGAAQGVLAYLIQRRQERAALDLENRRNQNRVAETNATVSRASTMPRIGSVVKSQQPSQSAGLINARRA